MAKVLLINGSPRENGNTFIALSEVAKTLNEEGVDTEIISIGKQAVQGCIACGMCGRNGARCTFRDDLYYKVWRAVKDGIDGLVIGSPVFSDACTSITIKHATARSQSTKGIRSFINDNFGNS